MRLETSKDGEQGIEARSIHLGIGLTLYSAALAWSTARVEDDLGIHTSEEDEADDPVCVSEDGATQEDHLDIDRRHLSVASDSCVEFVHVGVRTVAFDCKGVEGTGAVLGRAKISENGRCISGLEVSLSIEVL